MMRAVESVSELNPTVPGDEGGPRGSAEVRAVRLVQAVESDNGRGWMRMSWKEGEYERTVRQIAVAWIMCCSRHGGSAPGSGIDQGRNRV